MNIGATVARTGHLVVHDEWTRFLREYAPVTLREQPSYWQTRYIQFVGWYIDDTDPSRVVPQFFPFHPALIAVGISLAGLYGGLLVTPIWGVLSIAVVYFLARRLFGPLTGLLAASLLALTPTHIWFARYPTTESLTLLLVFTGLLAFQVLWDESSPHLAWGLLGGAAFGAAFLTRIDLPLLVVLLIGAMIVRRWQRSWSKAWTAFALTLIVFTVHALLSAVMINWPYVWNTYSSVLVVVSRLAPVIAGASLVGIALIGIGWLALRRGGARPLDGWRQAIGSSRVRWFLIAAVILLSMYAYFVRPILEPIHYAKVWPSGNEFPILDGQNWVRMGWYLTPLGLLLATLGLAVILRRESLGRLGLFLSVGVLTTIQYVYNIMNTPYHIYTMRRYVPIVIPMLMIYAAVAIVAVFRAKRAQRVWLGHIGGAVLALSLMAGLAYQSRFVLPQRDLYSAVHQLRVLNSRLKPDAIIVISEPSESIFADTFGPPLQFIFGHDIATIRQDGTGVLPFIQALRARATEQHRPLQLIAIDPILPGVRQNLPLQPLEMFPVTLRMLMSTFTDYPSVIQTAYYGIEIYDVTDQPSSTPSLIDIDIGTLDAAFIRSGFYGKEYLPGAPTMRWTTGEATLDIPLSAEMPVTVEVRAMIFRPASLPAADVVITLDGQEIGRFQPDETWQTFSFQGQAKPVGGISSLQFRTATFNPASLHFNGDKRDLGFLVDWVKIRYR
jgi:4-amino-4-deoxy-L-arabinose transferase-like glycosyltransferase